MCVVVTPKLRNVTTLPESPGGTVPASDHCPVASKAPKAIWTNSGVLSPAVPTFAHQLARAGYETVLCGRMHFLGPDQFHILGRCHLACQYPGRISREHPEHEKKQQGDSQKNRNNSQ